MQVSEWDRSLLGLMRDAMNAAAQAAIAWEKLDPETSNRMWDIAFKHWRERVLLAAKVRAGLN